MIHQAHEGPVCLRDVSDEIARRVVQDGLAVNDKCGGVIANHMKQQTMVFIRLKPWPQHDFIF